MLPQSQLQPYIKMVTVVIICFWWNILSFEILLFVNGQSDHYYPNHRPQLRVDFPQRWSGLKRGLNSITESPPLSPIAKYSATILGPPTLASSKLNRFFRPRFHSVRSSSSSSYKRRGIKHRGRYDGDKDSSGDNKVSNFGIEQDNNVIKGAVITTFENDNNLKNYDGISNAKAVDKVVAPIPVRTRHEYRFRDYLKEEDNKAGSRVIEVLAHSLPLSLVFRSSSSKVNIKQVHNERLKYDPSKHSFSEDAPHVLKHTITKPIYQMVQEVIVPYRKITQYMNPIQEEITSHINTHTGSPQMPSPTFPQQPPALLNSYQIEPVLYVSPEDIKTQVEVQPVSHVPVQPVLENQQQQLDNIEHLHQQQPHAQIALVEPTFSSSPQYESVQPIVAKVVPGTSFAEVSTSHLVSPQTSSQTLNYGEHNSVSPPISPPTPVALIADVNLLDTYLRYAQISAEDLLLPMFATSASAEDTHLPQEIVANHQDSISSTSEQIVNNIPDQQQQYLTTINNEHIHTQPINTENPVQTGAQNIQDIVTTSSSAASSLPSTSLSSLSSISEISLQNS